jgi:hypothetical protein
MAKKRGNPNWGKPEMVGAGVSTITEFQRVASDFNLQPDQYIRSAQLREWASRNKNSKFIPETLLKAWGLEVGWTL